MVLYGCYLIILYYEENISMQHTMFSNYMETAKISSEMDGILVDEGDGCADIEDPDSQEASVAEKEEGGALDNNFPGLDTIPTTELNDRIVKMMDPENKTLLAQAFRQTVMGTEPGKLWPIRKPQPFTPSRPQFAGKYAVLVIDEPRKQFYKSNIASLTLLKRRKKNVKEEPKQSYWESLKLFFNRGQRNGKREEEEIGEEDIDIPLPRGISLARENLRERKPKSKFCGMMKESMEHVNQTFRDRRERFQFIAQTFQKLYGDDFNCIIPIYNTEVCCFASCGMTQGLPCILF
jgi:CRISPR/Cas system CSM-associated protein Csm2 small subunit